VPFTLNSEVASKLRPSVRRANRNASSGRTELGGDRPRTALPQAPKRAHGPPSENETDRHGRPHARPRYEVHHMATITKLRNKIEHVSALKGWRMRWHMQ
jgi:hypothetical protein